jgi:hypothetical protein
MRRWLIALAWYAAAGRPTSGYGSGVGWLVARVHPTVR